MAAVAAVQAQEAVREDAAFEEGVELVLDELRQVGAGSRLCLGDEGRGVLLRQRRRYDLRPAGAALSRQSQLLWRPAPLDRVTV